MASASPGTDDVRMNAGDETNSVAAQPSATDSNDSMRTGASGTVLAARRVRAKVVGQRYDAHRDHEPHDGDLGGPLFAEALDLGQRDVPHLFGVVSNVIDGETVL